MPDTADNKQVKTTTTNNPDSSFTVGDYTMATLSTMRGTLYGVAETFALAGPGATAGVKILTSGASAVPFTAIDVVMKWEEEGPAQALITGILSSGASIVVGAQIGAVVGGTAGLGLGAIPGAIVGGIAGGITNLIASKMLDETWDYAEDKINETFYNYSSDGNLNVDTQFNNINDIKDLINPFITQESISAEVDNLTVTAKINGEITAEYKVQEGDTVWGIAQEYGMSVADILALNPWLTAEGRVSDDQSFILIKPGEKLQITPDWATYLKGKDEDLFMGSLTSNFAEAEALTINRPPVDPLILDLDGDGIETTTIGDGIYFDHETDGFAEKSSWTGNNDIIMFDKYDIKIIA